MTVPPLRTALHEVAAEHLSHAERLETEARQGGRPVSDPYMEARRLRVLAEQAQRLAALLT